MMTTITVCKGCRQQMQAVDAQGKPACVTCIGLSPESGVPIEVQMPEAFTCDICKVSTSTDEILKEWKDVPFATADGHYYCGCRGGD